MLGQAGGYSAKSYSRLGYNTSFIGFLGKDFCGKAILENFKIFKIDTSGIGIDPTGTARSINFMFKDGRRKNFYDGKGHMNLSVDKKVAQKIFKQSRFVHFHIPNWARELLDLAKKEGCVIATDIQDVTDPYDNYRLDFIKKSDFIFFSATNANCLDDYFKAFLQLNPNLTLIAGKGKEGCAVATNSYRKDFSSIELEKPVVDSNGAGDSLACGFLSSYLMENKSIEEAILRGQINARYTCTLKADSDYMLSGDELSKIVADKAYSSN